MSKENNLTDFLTSLADKLRAKLGTAEAINPQDFDDKVDEVFAAGGKAEYERFWDEYQDYGDTTNYQYAFAYRGWNDDTFNPKYKNISPLIAYAMFDSTYITNIKSKINFDTSNATNMNSMFANGKVTETGEINAASTKILTRVFASTSLKKIDKLILNENNSFNNTFQNALALNEITIEGIIGQNGFDVHWSTKLSKNSIISIINALSSAASGLTVTFSKTAVDTAFAEAEWAELIATKPNWTIALV